ncbi:prevent-host-death family protein [Nocardia amikacinitolerans]|nr:prevent-host-death family protein [Nocardia amikacinitolerans]
MTTMTAAEAARNFSAVLDRAERGETITIVRHGMAVATIAPPTRKTGRSLRHSLENSDVPPFDDDFAADTAAGLAMVDDDMAKKQLG